MLRRPAIRPRDLRRNMCCRVGVRFECATTTCNFANKVRQRRPHRPGRRRLGERGVPDRFRLFAREREPALRFAVEMQTRRVFGRLSARRESINAHARRNDGTPAVASGGSKLTGCLSLADVAVPPCPRNPFHRAADVHGDAVVPTHQTRLIASLGVSPTADSPLRSAGRAPKCRPQIEVGFRSAAVGVRALARGTELAWRFSPGVPSIIDAVDVLSADFMKERLQTVARVTAGELGAHAIRRQRHLAKRKHARGMPSSPPRRDPRLAVSDVQADTSQTRRLHEPTPRSSSSR